MEIEQEGAVHNKNKMFFKLSLPLSIVLAGVLIAGSVLYNGKKIVESLDEGFVKVSPPLTGNLQQAGSGAGQAAAQAPTGPVSVNERKDAPVKGNANAKVTIYEFSDFQCPFCKAFFEQTESQLLKEYVDTGKVKIVYRHFPLPFHVNAEIAAVAAECANQQDKFWEYHDLLFKNGQADGKGLEAESLKKYADSLGLNSGKLGFGKNKFNQCLDSKATLSIVKQDTADGTAAGVNGTPSFYISGKQIVGAQPIAVFKQAIDEALK
jgi:protein-disulfide isomerase